MMCKLLFFAGFTFGDPHIQTLDGFHYTFNGLGEFEHLIVYNATNPDNVLMKIQCRTKEVGTGGRRATSFSGFVIWSENVAIQISTREQMEGKIFYQYWSKESSLRTWQKCCLDIQDIGSIVEIYLFTVTQWSKRLVDLDFET